MRETDKIIGLGMEKLGHLLDLARDRSVGAREELVETVSDLFFDDGRVLTDHERSLMTDILRQLIHDVEMAVRRKLADRLADQPNAPHELVLTLANDDIEVAHPILLNTDVLHDAELIEIVRHRTLEHQLAIAMRRSLNEPVSNALVETGNKTVIQTLLENENARISRATMEYLVEQSAQIDEFQNPLLHRPDLGSELAARMYWWVSAALRQHILTNFDIDPDQLDATIENSVVESMASEGDSTDREKGSASSALADRLADEDSITPQLLIQALRQGEVSLFQSLFGKLAQIRPRLVRRLMFEPNGEALAVACKALRIDKADFASIFLLSRKARPGDKSVDPDELTRALAMFDRVMPDGARRVLSRWQRDPKFAEAIAQVEGGQAQKSKAAQ